MLFGNKKKLVDFDFKYSFLECWIGSRSYVEVNDPLLISTYVMFVARYFYICDERQVDVMKEFLKSFYPEAFGEEPGYYFGKCGIVYEKIFDTMNQNEKNALLKLFDIPLKMPPFTISKETPKNELTKYSFKLFQNGNKLASTFHLAVGPDKILLPLTVVLFYEYIISQLSDKNMQRTLNTISKKMIDSYDKVSCRDMESLIQTPRELLVGYNIFG